MIHIYDTPEPGLRLKSYTATVRGAASVLRIEIAIDDPRRLGWLLAELAALDKAQKAAKAAPRHLALPAPQD